ncbi:MAG: sigma-70 family RNA polymerase sigma factor [Bdellovibrionales bacterium]|nr:sigma-70 family RNA polymerase sigma factor [Bdellovibrionales bacterium]
MKDENWPSCVVFAERLASRFYRVLPHGHVELEELKSAALLGLVEARNRYKEGTGATFQTFAYLRIRGAMCDFLRSERRVSGNRAPEKPESPAPLELPDPEFTILGSAHAAPEAGSMEEAVELRLAVRKIASALSTVEDKQRQVVLKHYFEDKSFSEIGNELGGIAKATVCRYHRKALNVLREEFREVA